MGLGGADEDVQQGRRKRPRSHPARRVPPGGDRRGEERDDERADESSDGPYDEAYDESYDGAYDGPSDDGLAPAHPEEAADRPRPGRGDRPRRPGQGGRPARPTSGRRPPGRPAPRFARPMTAKTVLGWTLLSALVPGAAHLRAGRRRTGYILLGLFAALIIGGGAYAVQFRGHLGGAVAESTLNTLMIAFGVLAVAWFAVVVMSYVALNPNRLPQSGQVVTGVVVGVLCVAVMAPFAVTAKYVKTANDTLGAIFPSTDDGSSVAPIKAEDPWAGRKRVNFLLIGGDAAGNREGVRTDSMTVASVNIGSGNTVLFSLPRNLQFARFTPGTKMAHLFPQGYNAEGQGLLNSVYYYFANSPQLGVKPIDGLKDIIGNTLGLHIDYYAMVDMFGFAAMIDAIGGLKIRVERDIKWGGHFGTAGTIKAGYRVLNGEEVLWYGRSRVDSDDFSRMARQRCVIGALTQQASPAVVLQNFDKIAAAARHLFKTDIPRPLLEHLVTLGLKVKSAKITSLQFVPPTIWPGAADWVKIRQMTRQAIRESVAGPLTAGVTASPNVVASGSGVAPSPSLSNDPTRNKPSQTPTPNDKAAKTLSELCGF
ncbi:LCP family protein [Streptosporangiaceae bacterium NEAU-GS5]|nr:LCP family protein [Streptosporangiaceae bacterium NEAU-GS5]